MALWDLPVEGTHHRGVDDAWNTGLLLSRLLWPNRNGGAAGKL
jgi:inhibitor of KinA sporulation pathway (predicted exonuclease)